MTETAHIPGGFVQRVNEAVDDWWTPPGIFDALGVEYDIDVCAPEHSNGHVPAKRFLRPIDDGLAVEWGDSFVWCNPPYKGAGAWMRRLAEHGNGIALTFARTDTRWVQEVLPKTGAICLIAGRLSFLKGGAKSGTSGAPSMLWGFGSGIGPVMECGLGFSIDIRRGDI